MKTLPDNPHLHHVRRQAKDLLAGLRDTNPNATLADAQACLAQQYGFRTWAELKAEVDRGQGGAEVADPTLARQIAARFGLGEVTGAMRSLFRPDEVGRRWVMDTEQGRFAVGTVDDVYPVTDGEENTRFQTAAAQVGVLLPSPVRSVSGVPVERIGASRWRVYQWLYSSPPLAAPVAAAVAREVGEILARLHALRFPVDRVCPWNAERLDETSWAQLVRTAAASGAGWSTELATAIPALAELEAIGDGVPTSQPVLCHNNITPGNVRLGAGGRLIVTRWEHASGLPPEWELAQVLAHWTVNPDGEVNTAGVRALLAGYGAPAGVLCLDTFRGTAIGTVNYVSGQLQLALDATDSEQRRHADRNVRHLLAHLPSRAIYERILDAVG